MFNKEEFIQDIDKKKKEETKSIALYLTTHITLYIVLIFFLIFFIWYTVFSVTHRYYIVEGASMQPYLNASIAPTDTSSSQDAVYVNLNGKIEVYDVVVIEGVSKTSPSIIKRVVAEEGDFVSIAKSGNSFFLFRIDAEDMTLNENNEYTTLVSDENALVFENERNTGYEIRYDDWNGVDERVYNGVHYDYGFYSQFIQGYVNESDAYSYYVSSDNLIYVQVPEGKTFCLGDNRAHSSDSRTYGFISYDNIVGDVEITVYNYSFVNRVFEVIKYYYYQVEEFFAR